MPVIFLSVSALYVQSIWFLYHELGGFVTNELHSVQFGDKAEQMLLGMCC